MEKTFQKTEIVKIAARMHKAGKTWRQIAEHLNANNYTNSRGKPYTEGGIWTLVTVSSDPDYKGRLARSQETTEAPTVFHPSSFVQPQKTLANRDQTIVDLKRSIIDLEGVTSEKKLELLELTARL